MQFPGEVGGRGSKVRKVSKREYLNIVYQVWVEIAVGNLEIKRIWKSNTQFCFKYAMLFTLRKLAHAVNRDFFSFKK